MKKVRINELARELEVKPGVIIDLLPELGVHEKKTHSSSVDEEVALELVVHTPRPVAVFGCGQTVWNCVHLRGRQTDRIALSIVRRQNR